MKNLKNDFKSKKREFIWIEYGSRWSCDWDLRMLSIDDIEKKYKDGVDELLSDEEWYGKGIVEEFCELKVDRDRNIFSCILSDDCEELFIEVNEKNNDLLELFNKEDVYEIGDRVDGLFGRMSWKEIIKEYKILEKFEESMS